jgi:hypothetical protein
VTWASHRRGLGRQVIQVNQIEDEKYYQEFFAKKL